MPLPQTIRQIRCVAGADGRFDWQLVNAPLPTPSDSQILLRTHAVSIQRGDLEMRDQVFFETDAQIGSRGVIAGSDGAGEVIAVGAAVRHIKPGDKVFSLYFSNYAYAPETPPLMDRVHGWSTDGTMGDYVVLEETGVTPMPVGLSYAEGATLGSSAMTAWMATGARGTIKRGDTVVLQGTGGVSMFALQFALALGARVILTSSSDDKLARGAALGATDTINYRTTPDWAARVLELTAGRGADLVVDMGGADTLEQSVAALRYGGTLALVGGLGSYDASLAIFSLISKDLTVRGIMGGGTRSDAERMCAFVEQHAIHPIIERSYPIEGHGEAMADLQAGNFMGKLVLSL